MIKIVIIYVFGFKDQSCLTKILMIKLFMIDNINKKQMKKKMPIADKLSDSSS